MMTAGDTTIVTTDDHGTEHHVSRAWVDEAAMSTETTITPEQQEDARARGFASMTQRLTGCLNLQGEATLLTAELEGSLAALDRIRERIVDRIDRFNRAIERAEVVDTESDRPDAPEVSRV